MKMFMVAIFAIAAVHSAPTDLKDAEMVEYINANSKTWTASHYTEIDIETRGIPLGYRKMTADPIKHKPPQIDAAIRIPWEFDARTEWPNCTSISHIRDQSNCGSCWAVASASVMSDRQCIFGKTSTYQENLNHYYSALDIMSCCKSEYCSGCSGGSSLAAFEYWAESGVVSGSSYAENSGCRPYPFPACGSTRATHTNATETVGARKTKCERNFATPKCVDECDDGQNYYYEKVNRGSAYQIDASIPAIQREILTNGPIVTEMTVYEDFRKYKGGIYQHTYGKEVAYHAVKIIGWGNEDGVNYWLAANSWGPNWGESGFFRIRRGVGESAFEFDLFAGMPPV